MVLVTGPTGSGKTTTLYAALSEIKSIEDKIVTIEDPVEYQLRGITQIPINEKKGLTFARGLRSILRHDPDKIMVGEIRDPETAQIAIQSALTGHLVFTTVHANNVIDVLGRFLNMGVEPYQFVSALNCVLAQRLVRLICTHCKRPAQVDGGVPARIGARSGAGAARTRSTRARAASSAAAPGFKGRMAICELLDLTDRIRDMILEREPNSEIKRAAREEGMRFLRESRGRARDAGPDHAARDQQGDVRRMSARPRPGTPRRRWFASSPPPSVAVEIGAGRVTAVGRSATSAARRRSPAHATERLPDGLVAPSLDDAQPHRSRPPSPPPSQRVLDGASAREPRRVALVIPDGAAKVSLVRFEKVPAQGRRSRAAGALAGAQDGAVPDRAGAGRRGRGRRRRRPGAEFVVTVARRTSSTSTSRRAPRPGVQAGPRRSRDVQPGQPAAGRRRGPATAQRRLAARARDARFEHDGDRARRRAAPLPQPAGRGRGQPGRSRASDRDVLRRSPGGRGLRARRRRRRATSSRPAAATSQALGRALEQRASASRSWRSIRARCVRDRDRIAASPASCARRRRAGRRAAARAGGDDDAARPTSPPGRSTTSAWSTGCSAAAALLVASSPSFNVSEYLRLSGRQGGARPPTPRATRRMAAHARRRAPREARRQHRPEEPRARQRAGARGQRHHRRAHVLVDGACSTTSRRRCRRP